MIGNKKWFLTFSTESPVSTGFAVVMARDPKSAETAVKLHGTTFGKGAKMLAAAELDYSGGFCRDTQILAEGVTQQSIRFIPHIDQEGNLTWTNDGNLPNPEPLNIMGPQGKQGEPGEQGKQGIRGLQGPRGNAFKYEDFTPEQLEGLRGPIGPQGNSLEVQFSSDNITYSDTADENSKYIRFKCNGETEWSKGIYLRGEIGPKGEPGISIVTSEEEITEEDQVVIIDGADSEVILATKDDIPTKVSQLENDSQYVTQQELAEFDSEIFIIVTELPTTNVKENKIYLLHENNNINISNNRYNEYKAIIEPTGIKWELIGMTELSLNLEDYYTKKDTDNKYTTKQQLSESLQEVSNKLNNKVEKQEGKQLSSNDFTDTLKEKLENFSLDDLDLTEYVKTESLASVATSGSYNDLTDKPTIPTSIRDLTTDIYLGFNDTYVSDCNTWLTNGYIKVSEKTSRNWPSECTGADRWGILFFIAENETQGTGTQMYFPIDGTYKGRIFTRSLTNLKSNNSSIGTWNLLAIKSDIPAPVDTYTRTEIDTKLGDIDTILTSIIETV